MSVKHSLADIYSFFLHSKPNYRQEVLTWSLEVPQLGGSVVDFKDPVTGGSFSPAVNSHELPVFKSFHGVVKKPEREPSNTVLSVIYQVNTMINDLFKSICMFASKLEAIFILDITD